uniref:calmodulin-like protein 4 isoform X3 n=1 Tax=Jaculus jaculus TaxID=51337 RepID=UPI001E1B0DBA|nr:calmodulin-like protein 4 isoform X3 [Jaculus jaculus]
MAAEDLLPGPPPSLTDFQLEAREPNTVLKELSTHPAMAKFLSQDQINEYKECFSLYDKQQRGKIKATDLLVSMRCLGASPTPGEVQRHLKTHGVVDELFKEAGIEANGQVKYEEFIQKITLPVQDY